MFIKYITFRLGVFKFLKNIRIIIIRYYAYTAIIPVLYLLLNAVRVYYYYN